MRGPTGVQADLTPPTMSPFFSHLPPQWVHAPSHPGTYETMTAAPMVIIRPTTSSARSWKYTAGHVLEDVLDVPVLVGLDL